MGKTQILGSLVNTILTDSSNNVGIGGAANASFKLQVTGATNLTGALSGTSATFSGAITSSVATGNGSFYINNASLTNKNWTLIPSTSGVETDLLFFYTGASAGTRMTLTNGGNVGIGMSPNERLSVLGSNGLSGMIRWTDGATASAFLGITSGGISYIHSNNNSLAFGANGSNNFAETLRITGGNLEFNNSNATAYIYINQANSADGGVLFRRNNVNRFQYALSTPGDALVWYNYAAGSESMRITSGGNVGIGTSNPAGAAGLALVLNSGASQGRICIKTSATGDASGDGLQIGMAGLDAFIEQRENADLTFATNASERMRITSGGVLRFSSVPFNNYHLDTSVVITVANGGTIPFETFSGLVIVNNMSNGNVAMWMVGAGNTVKISEVYNAATGTMSYSGAINGYVWTSNFGSTANYGVFAIRTRANA